MTDGTEQKDVDYSNLIRAQTREVDIDAFKERGMKKVNVINAKKINELISQAVTNIIGRMEDADIQTIKDDKAQIVMDSMAEFKRLFSETRKEQDNQTKLQEEIELLRQALGKRESGDAASASSAQMDTVTEAIAELKAFMVNQASKAQSQEMTRGAMLEQQAQLLDDHFNELKSQLAVGPAASGKAGPGEDATKQAVEAAVDRLAKMLEKQEKGKNGATTETLLGAFGELRGDLDKKFGELTQAIRETGSSSRQADADTLRTELGALREDIRHAGAGELKAEIAALRADLEEKTVAASAASSAALQAQLTQMQELLAKGGGGGGHSGDLGDIVSKLEGSLSRKLAEAGIGKEEVSAEDALASSGVMLGAAFRDMDNIESNISGLDARKTVDKSGAKKAKGALDALKKLKGK